MNQKEIIEAIFKAMAKGEINYQIVRVHPTNCLALDLQNGIIIGDLLC